jgi:16S rRNA G1207 methylase RsmC
MNVEKTMDFILRQQATAEVEMAAIRKQQAKAETQMAAIRKLIQTGMRMIVRNEGLIKEVAAAQKELAKAQRVTETKLQNFIDAMRRGGNGNHRKD